MPESRQNIVSRHPEDFKLHGQRQVNVEVCEKILLDIKEILDSQGIRFWLWFGTFLGAYRDRAVIPWDDDMDLAAYYEDIEGIASLENMFLDKGFEISMDYWRGEKRLLLYRDREHIDFAPFRLSVIPFFTWSRSGACIELRKELEKLRAQPRFNHFTFAIFDSSPPMLTIREKNTFACDLLGEGIKIRSLQLAPAGVRHQGYYLVDIDAFETPSWVEFLGQKWRIPSNPEKWLGYIYGPNWRIPDKDPEAGKLKGVRPLVQRLVYEVSLGEKDNEAIYTLLSSHYPPEFFPLGARGVESEEVPIVLYPYAEPLFVEYLAKVKNK